MNYAVPVISSLVTVIAVLALAKWCINDALARGRSGNLVCLIVLLCFPFGLIAWLLSRPNVVERPRKSFNDDGMKSGTKSVLLAVGIFVGILVALVSFATWLNPLRPIIGKRLRNIEALRAADHAELLAACRAVMAEAHTFTNDSEVEYWHSGWQASLNRDSLQYRSKLPSPVRDLQPACVRIATNQVYLFYFGPPFKLAVRAFAPGAEQFGTEQLCDGLWIVTRTDD